MSVYLLNITEMELEPEPIKLKEQSLIKTQKNSQ